MMQSPQITKPAPVALVRMIIDNKRWHTGTQHHGVPGSAIIAVYVEDLPLDAMHNHLCICPACQQP